MVWGLSIYEANFLYMKSTFTKWNKIYVFIESFFISLSLNIVFDTDQLVRLWNWIFVYEVIIGAEVRRPIWNDILKYTWAFIVAQSVWRQRFSKLFLDIR